MLLAEDFWQSDPPASGFLASIPVEYMLRARRCAAKIDVAHGQAILWGQGRTQSKDSQSWPRAFAPRMRGYSRCRKSSEKAACLNMHSIFWTADQTGFQAVG